MWGREYPYDFENKSPETRLNSYLFEYPRKNSQSKAKSGVHCDQNTILGNLLRNECVVMLPN